MILDPAIDVARKGALAYVGAVALTSDEITKAVRQFTERGTKFEQAAREQLAKVEHAARERLSHATRSLRRPAKEGEDTGEPAANVLEQGRDRLLATLYLPTHSDFTKLNLEVERIVSAVDELRSQRRRQARAAEPLPGYEKLNVDAVVDRLAKLDEPALLAVRAYEQAHSKRITVLRAVERTLIERQAARGALGEPGARATVDPLPRYEEHTVEEIVERLAGLSEAELLHVSVYEQEHQKRAAVLQAIEEHMGEKMPA